MRYFPSTPAANRQRFSLTELVLILTVLLSVLAVIGPGCYRYVGKRNSLGCQDNLRELGLRISMFITDANDQYLPTYEDGWVAQVNSVIDEENHRANQEKRPSGYWACPAQDHDSMKPGIGATEYWRGTNYGINQHLASNLKDSFGQPYPQWARASLRDITEMASKLLIADSPGGNYHDVDGRDPVVAGLSRSGWTYAQAVGDSPARPLPYLRHTDGTGNFLFLDTHVETLQSFPSFMLGPGTRGFQFWHPEHAYPGSGKTPVTPTSGNAFGPNSPTDRRDDGLHDAPLGGGSRSVRPTGAGTGNLGR